MKHTFVKQILLASGLFLIGGLTEAQAQKRPVKRPVKAAVTVAPRTGGAATDSQSGAQKIAIQSKNLSRFLFTLGGVAERIRAEDAAIRDGGASGDSARQNQQNKQVVVTTIRNIRDGLDKLETEFRFNETLKPVYGKIYGISVLAETAETLAARGNFDGAGKQLLEVVYKLNDALLEIR